MTHNAFTTLQRAFRFRDDTTALNTDGGWTDAQDSDPTISVDTTFRVRFSIEETGGDSSGNIASQLQYRYNSGAGFGAWTNVTGTSSVIQASASGQFADGDACSTQLLTGFAGTFDPDGLADENDGASSNANLTNAQALEMEFSLSIVSADVADTDLIELRVTDGGTVLDSYGTADTNIPQITVSEVASVVNQVAFRFYDDDATPASATAAFAENTNGTFNDHERFQLRVGLEVTSGDPASTAYELYAQKNGTGGYSRVTDLTDIRVWLSPNWADDIATTDRLTTPAGTFTAGRADEVDGAMTTVDLGTSQNTELVWNLLMKRKNANNDFWDFEVRRSGGGSLDTYTRRPRVTMSRRAAEPGYIEVKLSTATGTPGTRTAGMATIANDASLNPIGEDFEIRGHLELSTWRPSTGETTIRIADHWITTGGQRSYFLQTSEFAGAADVELGVSEDGTGQTYAATPSVNGADATVQQFRIVHDGNNGSSQHVVTAYARTASIDPDTLDDGGSWGTAVETVGPAAPALVTLHPSTGTFRAFGNENNQAGGYVGSKYYRLMVWEGFAATGRLVVDIPYFDRAYRAPEATNDELWVNQGEAPGVVTLVGTHVTDWDWVASAAGPQQIAVGQASETDTASGIALAKAVGQASETDTATAIAPSRNVTVGQATEADTAAAITVTKSGAVGQATEADSALAVTSTKSEPVGQASETDTANAVDASRNVAVDQATETDTATAIGVTRSEAVGQATEADTALAIAITRTEPVGQASETDTARAIAVDQTQQIAVGQATETDSATAITHTRTEAAGQATETDTAQTIDPLKNVALGQASEVDTAAGVTVTRSAAVGQATETDTATAIDHTRSEAVGQAAETDTAQAITVQQGQNIAVGQATETDTAAAIAATKSEAVGQASETDTAQAITVSQGQDIAVGQASETDTALAIGTTRVEAVGQAIEADSALPIAVSRTVQVGPASEIDTAQPVAATRSQVVGQATEADTALAVSWVRFESVGIATEVDTALAITIVTTAAPTVEEPTRVTFTGPAGVAFSIAGGVSNNGRGGVEW